MRGLFLLLVLSTTLNLSAATYYVSPNGNDANPGTLSLPWKTWNKAFASRSPGDIVYFRGGVYYMTDLTGQGYDQDIIGTASDSILLLNYPGERPILDCSNITSITGDNHHALTLHLTYARVRGLTVRNVWQLNSSKEVQAWTIVGNHAVVDNCVCYNSHGRGFWIVNSDELTMKNCDSYNHCDALTSVLPGNDGYGYFIQDMETTTRKVYLRQCRAWRCADDGFTCYSNAYVEFDRCWSFNNGQLQGEGHGFKLGWLEAESSSLRRVVKNCLAVWNKSDGINTNDEPASSPAAVMNVFNNTSYHNTTSSVGGDAYGYIIFNSGSSDAIERGRVFKNNIAYQNKAGDILATANALYTDSYNSWDLAVTITDADFVSTDTTGISSPRSSNGSLPDMRGFMKLASSSDLIDKGTSVGMSYSGSAPDLGYAEYITPISSVSPAYVSSVIQNNSPSKLEITFSQNLGSVIPATSAFSVKVNSLVRNINTVSISGTKVYLTLASPVVYGDVITISYTKPSTNPLQGTTSELVSGFTDKSVTNNCLQSLIAVTSVTLSGAGNANTISVANGTLQLYANVLPTNAANRSVSWSIQNGTGTATISSAGLVTALSNGTVTARASAIDGSGVSGTMMLTLSNQTLKVSSISVSIASGSSTSDNSIQMLANVLPSDATNKTISWSVINGTGQATISSSGLLTPISNGSVTVKAIANDGSGISGSIQLTLSRSSSFIPIYSITVAPYNNAIPKISRRNGKLRMVASILPFNATNKTVEWSIESITGLAIIDYTGLVTAKKNGTVKVIAKSTDGSNVSGYCLIEITNQNISKYRTYYQSGMLVITADQTQLSSTSENNEIIMSSQAAIAENEINYAIFNIQGQLIYSYSTSETMVEVDVTDFLPGVYIISINGIDSHESLKVSIP